MATMYDLNSDGMSSNNQNNEDNCQTELDVALWNRSKVQNWSQDNTSGKISHYQQDQQNNENHPEPSLY